MKGTRADLEVHKTCMPRAIDNSGRGATGAAFASFAYGRGQPLSVGSSPYLLYILLFARHQRGHRYPALRSECLHWDDERSKVQKASAADISGDLLK